MHLAAIRVRHLSNNQTQDYMLTYNCNHTLFEEMKHVMNIDSDSGITRTAKAGLYVTIPALHFGNSFINHEVRVTGNEIADLIAPKLGLQRSPQTRTIIQSLPFQVGQKLVRTDGHTLWATDTRYSKGNVGRRDLLRLQGQLDGNGLCGEAVCFVTLDNVQTIPHVITDKNFVTYVLIRWLEPHPDSWERDSLLRPVCPGPLHVNNCLWQYAKTANMRPALGERSFNRNKNIFGHTVSEQNLRREHEKFAWYDLVSPDNVIETVNMCPLFEPNTCLLSSQVWLQTVTVV